MYISRSRADGQLTDIIDVSNETPREDGHYLRLRPECKDRFVYITNTQNLLYFRTEWYLWILFLLCRAGRSTYGRKLGEMLRLFGAVRPHEVVASKKTAGEANMRSKDRVHAEHLADPKTRGRR